jgi:hypothetical protein
MVYVFRVAFFLLKFVFDVSFEILWIFRSNNHFAWWFMVFNATQQYFSYIVVVSFIGG